VLKTIKTYVDVYFLKTEIYLQNIHYVDYFNYFKINLLMVQV